MNNAQIIETIGQMKQVMQMYSDDTRIGIEDADTGWPLYIGNTNDVENGLLLFETNYNNEIKIGVSVKNAD